MLGRIQIESDDVVDGLPVVFVAGERLSCGALLSRSPEPNTCPTALCAASRRAGAGGATASNTVTHVLGINCYLCPVRSDFVSINAGWIGLGPNLPGS